MPYIKDDNNRRLELDNEALAVNCGELNYKITRLFQQYLGVKGESYQTYNDIVGAGNCAIMELERRKIGNYEDKKINENGDVW